MLRRKSTNCEDSSRSFDRMFCVSCNPVTICQRYEDFSVASTISGLDPCRTTDKICRQSPAKSTASPPNGNDFFFECLALFCLLIQLHACVPKRIPGIRAFNNIAQRQKWELRLDLKVHLRCAYHPRSRFNSLIIKNNRFMKQ